MSYQIITDTCCDFPMEMYGELGLTAVPLSVLYKGVNYNEYTESWLKEFFDGLRAGETSSTAAAASAAGAASVLSIFAPPELPPQAARETAMTAPRRIPNSFFLITMNPPFFLKCPTGTPDPPEKPCRRFFRRVVYKESQE